MAAVRALTAGKAPNAAADLSGAAASTMATVPGPSSEPATIAAALPGGAVPSAVTAAVATQIAQLLSGSSDADSVTIRLDPPELGLLDIELVFESNRVTATLTAERPETLEMLRRHTDMLQRDLAASGFAGADIAFGDRRPGEGGHQQPGDAQPSGMAAVSPMAPAAPALATRTTAAGRLDIRL